MAGSTAPDGPGCAAGEDRLRDLEDTQSGADPRDIAIHRVGIRDIRHPLEILDRDGKGHPTVARASLAVSLPGHVRGTHMSRFVTFLNERVHRVCVRTIGELPLRVSELLQAEAATVELEFPFFLTKEAPVTGATGKIDYEVTLGSQVEGRQVLSRVTVRVPVTTLCPCSRNISERGAHNQRGVVAITAEGARLPWLVDLIRAAESGASAELFSVLKRPDEKHVTERAYDNPVFVEDLVRNVAQNLRAFPELRSFRIEAENFESIHNHNAFAVVES